MAMEDAYSLATCLQLGGKTNAPLAVRVHNYLRQVLIPVQGRRRQYAYATQV